MQEFESFVYLDVQKTGSSFIIFLLRTFCREQQIRAAKHRSVGAPYDSNKFHFISVRTPLDQYLSLYSYGCSGKGALYRRLGRRGKEHLYDSTWKGFKRWLRFILDEEHAELLVGDGKGDYKGRVQQLIGFQTYRYLELALAEPSNALGACETRDDVRDVYKRLNIAQFHVRHESFRGDLKELLTTRIPAAMGDLQAALKFAAEGNPINVSDRVDAFEIDAELSPKLAGVLAEREWLMAELFGY